MENLISVVLPIYKEDINLIKLSVQSILEQKNSVFELLIIVDNPKLGVDVGNYLQNLDNALSHVSVLYNDHNLGLPMSLNKAISFAKGNFIARMDADDIAMPTRLNKQLEFLLKNQSIDLVGSSINLIDENEKKIGFRKATSKCDYRSLISRTLCYHPTWLVRRAVFDKLKYRDLKYCQDLDFLHRFIQSGFLASNIQEPLLSYRVTGENFNAQKRLEQFATTKAIRSSKFDNYELSNIYSERDRILADAANVASFLKYDSIFLRKGVTFIVSILMSRYHRDVFKHIILSKVR
ncbi:glycosyltransferase [Vibrio splendidus]|uniref:glycosyltransferase n=1 Tax=Vibrio splendidus TaxID=29497 RepID=UPI0011B3963A|nr:glycosyltransferase [Vibrio splendidus]